MTEQQPVPAATVVLARDNAAGSDIEVLLLRRNAKLVFHGGHWVFPGGRIDAEDFAVAGSELEFPAARQAAVRETREESGIEISPDQLIHIAHWTTPPRLARRFSTWFFACLLRERVEVVVDNAEILDFRWMPPREALRAAEQKQLVLPGPTHATLTDIANLNSLQSLESALSEGEVRVFPEDSAYYKPEEMGYS